MRRCLRQRPRPVVTNNVKRYTKKLWAGDVGSEFDIIFLRFLLGPYPNWKSVWYQSLTSFLKALSPFLYPLLQSILCCSRSMSRGKMKQYEDDGVNESYEHAGVLHDPRAGSYIVYPGVVRETSFSSL